MNDANVETDKYPLSISTMLMIENEIIDSIYESILSILTKSIRQFGTNIVDIMFEFDQECSGGDSISYEMNSDLLPCCKITWTVKTNFMLPFMLQSVMTAVQQRMITEFGSVGFVYYYPYYNVATIIINPNY